jgi:hypothetical protein
MNLFNNLLESSSLSDPDHIILTPGKSIYVLDLENSRQRGRTKYCKVKDSGGNVSRKIFGIIQ